MSWQSFNFTHITVFVAFCFRELAAYILSGSPGQTTYADPKSSTKNEEARLGQSSAAPILATPFNPDIFIEMWGEHLDSGNEAQGLKT